MSSRSRRLPHLEPCPDHPTDRYGVPPAGRPRRHILAADYQAAAVGRAHLARGRRPAGPAAPLVELRALLLHPATSAHARNQVWAEMVRRARADGPALVIG